MMHLSGLSGVGYYCKHVKRVEETEEILLQALNNMCEGAELT
jgi:hypothetical protein